MSTQLINQYYATVDRLKQYGGKDNEAVVDTKSDVRANPKISGTGHNVFGIQTGVAVMFLVRQRG
jgi:hypothetical protein